MTLFPERNVAYQHKDGSVRLVLGVSCDGTEVTYSTTGREQTWRESSKQFSEWLTGAVPLNGKALGQDVPFPSVCACCGQQLFPANDVRHVRYMSWLNESSGSKFWVHVACWEALFSLGRQVRPWPQFPR